MRPPDDRALLYDMVRASRRARAFAEGITYKDFLDDEMRQLALVKLLEIVSEAASKVSPKTRSALQAVPWANIVGMRHHPVHGYARIDLDIV